MTEHNYIECECDSAEHVVRLSVEPTDDCLPLWFEFHLLHHRRWWSRVWVAIKYIFGYKAKYGNFDVCCPTREGARKMVEVINKAYPHEA